MDSCFAIIGAHQHATAVGSMNVENPHVSKTLYCRGEWKHSFKRQARSLSRVGWFSRALAFRSLDYPWAKIGTICSLPLTRQIRSQVIVLSYQSTFTSPEPPVHLAGEAWSSCSGLAGHGNGRLWGRVWPVPWSEKRVTKNSEKKDENDDDDDYDDDHSNSRMGDIFYLRFQMKIKWTVCLPRLVEIGRCATRLSGEYSRIPVNRIIAYLMDLL